MPEPGEWLRHAADPGTDQMLLRAIMRYGARMPGVRAALARNPSTPERCLHMLWAKEPAAILENPLTVLWELTRPDSAKKNLPERLQFALYQHLLVQEEFDLRRDLVDPRVVVKCLEIPRNGALRVPLHHFVRDTHRGIRVQLLNRAVRSEAESRGRPVEFPLKAVESLVADSNPAVLDSLAEAIALGHLRLETNDRASIRHISRSLIAKAGGSGPVVRKVARWPDLDAELIEEIAADADTALLAILATRQNASPGFQERLSSHGSEMVRAGLASSTSLPHLIRKLAGERNPTVLAGLASSPHLPPDLQRALFEGKDPRILLPLVKNPRLDPPILEAFSLLPHLSVETHLRNNPNTPAHVLSSLQSRWNHGDNHDNPPATAPGPSHP